MVYDVIVLGAGASGMCAAIEAAKQHDSVLLLEAGDRPGRKISASGNGRCNLMNVGEPRYYGDNAFAREVLQRFGTEKQTGFWNELGLMLTEENDGRIYPASFHSSSVMEVLKYALQKNGVEIRTGCRIVKAGKKADLFTVESDKGDRFSAKRLIVSLGGAAQPKLGGNRDGYAIMQSFGHTMRKVKPSLSQLITDTRSISGLKGIRIRATVTMTCEGETLYRDKGEVLFTENGISGICVMQCARFLREGAVVHLRFDDVAGSGYEELTDKLQMKREIMKDHPAEQLLDGWFVHKLGYGILRKAGTDLRDRNCSDITDEEIGRIAKTIEDYPLMVLDVQGFESAQVTSGGILCEEIDPENMESKMVKGLHCTGETLNVDGDCGGYNLMFAFATGILAGRNRRI